MRSKQIIKDQKGQGMTEYIIILALIAVASIKIFQLFGNTLNVSMGKITTSLQGQTYSGKDYKEFGDIDKTVVNNDLSNFSNK